MKHALHFPSVATSNLSIARTLIGNRRHNDDPAVVGLALLLDRPDDTIAHGNRALVRNDQLTWLTAADAPGFRSRRTIFRSAVAQLRNGQPALPFVPHPFCQHRQPGHATLTRLRAALARRTGGVPTGSMPRPYLSFDLVDCDSVLRLVHRSAGDFTPLIDSFRRSLGGGICLRATGPETYHGDGGDGRCGRLHWLRSAIDGGFRVVLLPVTSRVLVRARTQMEPGQPWARIPEDRGHSGLFRKRSGDAEFHHLLRLWILNQMIRLHDEPKSFLIPAELAKAAVLSVQPNGLWWDTRPFLHRYDWRWQSAVLPAWTASCRLSSPDKPGEGAPASVRVKDCMQDSTVAFNQIRSAG